jgi:PKD repeat protein
MQILHKTMGIKIKRIKKKIMKKYIKISPLLLIALSLLLVQCKKDIVGLNGSASKAEFTFVVKPLPDTLPFEPTVTFTNVSEEATQYQWDFGDNTFLSAEKNPIHKYLVGGDYAVRLTSVGTNGNNTITKRIFVIDACQNAFFNTLTGCNSNTVWTWSTDADAIKVLSADATQVFFSGAAAPCQVDDLYKFKVNGSFEYDAVGQTFDAQSGFSCQAPKPNAPTFKVVAKPGQLPKIILSALATGTGKPFIGTTDVVDNNLYTVQNYTATTMTLRANSGGNLLEVKLKKATGLGIAGIKALLTGAVSKTWRLDPSTGANSITVGNEGNPAFDYGGGPLDGNCQSDDRFTFTAANNIIYNANGSTFNGGNIAPNYNCGSDRSYNVAYTFGATTGGVAGLATIQLPGAPPTTFIGTTDVPSVNIYRIIDITATKMTLRAGSGTGQVFQFKFIAL